MGIGDVRGVEIHGLVNTFYWRMGHIMEHTTVDDPVGPLVLAGVLVRASVWGRAHMGGEGDLHASL